MGDTESYRKRNPQAGWYLFEFALVLFGTAVFIVGISDISRIFHARGAVRAGVTEGLRCLYPTDAGCNGQSMGNGWFPNDRFTARISGGGLSNLYELPRVSYRLSSAWFNEPVSEASFSAKQLTEVTLTQPRDAYRQYQVLFPGTAHAVYLLKTQELPRVVPGSQTDPREAILLPRFIDPPSGATRAPNKTLSDVSLSRNDGPREEDQSFEISLDDIFPNAAAWNNLKQLEAAYGFTASCYQGARTNLPNGQQVINWPPGGPPASCAYRSNSSPLYYGSGVQVPIMLHVTGDARVSAVAPGVTAKVELYLEHDGETTALGARIFSRGSSNAGPSQWGSFVVRGAGYNDSQRFDVSDSYVTKCQETPYDIVPGSQPPEPAECRKYVTLPLIKVGKPVKLRYKLTWSKQGGAMPNVNLTWTGRAKIFHPSFSLAHEQRPCGYSASPNSCGTSVAPMQTSFRTTNLDQAFSYSNRSETTCGRQNPDGYQSSIPNALEGFRSEIQAGARALQPIAFWSNGLSSDQCAPSTSKAPCSETAREYMNGCEPQDTFPQYAVGRCTLNDYQSNRDTISAPRYSYATLNKKESRGGCTGEPFPECSKPHLATKNPVFLGAVSNGCAVAQPVNTEPASYGPMFRNTCVDLLPGLIDEYRKKHRVPPSIGIPPGEIEEEPVITDKKPSECWEYDEITKDTRRTWLCAEASSYAVANNCCKQYGPEKCSIERVSTGGGGGSGDGFSQIIEGARQRAYETVQAAYPPARMDSACGQTVDGQPAEDDCIAIQAGPEANGTQARVQAAMRVPLALGDWFGVGDGTVVQYEESRTLESALVGEAS